MAVYFLRAGDDGLVKIGTAKDVTKRLAMLQTGCPAHLQIIRTIDGGQRHEAALHAHYKNLRQVGEWFSYCESMETVNIAPLPEKPKPERKKPKVAFEEIGSVSDLISFLGGPIFVARQIGSPSNTVVYWCQRGRLPTEHWDSIVKLAATIEPPVAVDHALLLRVCRARKRRTS